MDGGESPSREAITRSEGESYGYNPKGMCAMNLTKEKLKIFN